jgi:hypothetical protein
VAIGMFHEGYLAAAYESQVGTTKYAERFQPDSPRQRPHDLHETYQLPRVQLITPADGHGRCPKHVEFRDNINFWILDASCWLFIRRYLSETIKKHSTNNTKHTSYKYT